MRSGDLLGFLNQLVQTTPKDTEIKGILEQKIEKVTTPAKTQIQKFLT
jgi:hypothetical protein